MKSLIILLVILAILIGGSYFLFGRDSTENPEPKNNSLSGNNPSKVVKKNMKAVIKTNLGEIELELYSNDAPNTVANFVKLAKAGFYNKTKFHRVMKGFMIQGGDPLTIYDSEKEFWGTGGPGYKFSDEIHANNRNIMGSIAMANSGPNTNGSQFFINTVDNNYLDKKHTVFGKVTAGMEVVTSIENTATDENDRPINPIIVQTVDIIEE